MKKSLNKGFTLIELLVVIAIIGILSSVVLVSLNGARTKANAARATSDLSQVMTAIEMGLADNCTTVSSGPGGVGCNTTGARYMNAYPIAPSGFYYSGFGTTSSTTLDGTYSIQATGFAGGQKFTCTSGSCSCDTANGCNK